VKWPYRHLDGESDHKRPKSNRFYRVGVKTKHFSLQPRPGLQNLDEVKRSNHDSDYLRCQQETKRTAHGKKNELQRGIITFFAAPLINQEVHWNQTDLPEKEEEDQVKRHENTKHACFQNEEKDHEGFNLFLYIERSQDRQWSKQSGE